MRLLSFNVNGIRAIEKKGFLDWLKTDSPDIIGLQEIKAMPDQLSEEIKNPEGYGNVLWNPAERKGYSGTAIFSKPAWKSASKGFGIERFDSEGRITIAKYDAFTFINIYYPNGQKDDERLQYKMDFYDAFLEFADDLVQKGENLVICGDFNTAHREIDLAHPKANEKNSGFLPIERAWLDKFISHGYVDTFRYFYPELSQAYSWWSYRANARANNVGWRLDYFFVNEGFIDSVKSASILSDVTGSDHCPVELELDL